MGIRRKTIIILIVTLFSLMFILWISSEVIVKGGFNRVEYQSARKDTYRVLVALADDINTLDAVAADWASRDTIRHYVSENSSEDLQNMLDAEAFERLGFNYIVFLDRNGNKITGRGHNFVTHQDLAIRPSIMRTTADNSPLMLNGTLMNATLGIILDDYGPILIAIRPVFAVQNPSPLLPDIL